MLVRVRVGVAGGDRPPPPPIRMSFVPSASSSAAATAHARGAWPTLAVGGQALGADRARSVGSVRVALATRAAASVGSGMRVCAVEGRARWRAGGVVLMSPAALLVRLPHAHPAALP